MMETIGTSIKGNHISVSRETIAKSQNRLVLDHLLSDKPITGPEAGRQYLIAYLPARIHDVKKFFSIQEMIKDREVSYKRADGSEASITEYWMEPEDIQLFYDMFSDQIEIFGNKNQK